MNETWNLHARVDVPTYFEFEHNIRRSRVVLSDTTTRMEASEDTQIWTPETTRRVRSSINLSNIETQIGYWMQAHRCLHEQARQKVGLLYP